MQFVNPFDLITEEDEIGVRHPSGTINDDLPKPKENIVNEDEELIWF